MPAKLARSCRKQQASAAANKMFFMGSEEQEHKSRFRIGGAKNIGGRFTVPYDTLHDLPETVRQVLPKHAQEIYLAAFNNAWDQYREAEKRRDGDSREEVAHKIAWSAVRQKYEKHGERWQRKS